MVSKNCFFFGPGNYSEITSVFSLPQSASSVLPLNHVINFSVKSCNKFKRLRNFFVNMKRKVSSRKPSTSTVPLNC